MKVHLNITIDRECSTEIERMRGKMKRSTFVNRLIKLGLEIEKQKRGGVVA